MAGRDGGYGAGAWYDWWNETGTPGEGFVPIIETFVGLTWLGHTDSKVCRIRSNQRCGRESSEG
ncbi:MAG TPA: hypothetical protein VEI01_05050 [Terriglobales bacterium]|nr:hypothetical protein [Terriglobales bacterium]